MVMIMTIVVVMVVKLFLIIVNTQNLQVPNSKPSLLSQFSIQLNIWPILSQTQGKTQWIEKSSHKVSSCLELEQKSYKKKCTLSGKSWLSTLNWNIQPQWLTSIPSPCSWKVHIHCLANFTRIELETMSKRLRSTFPLLEVLSTLVKAIGLT